MVKINGVPIVAGTFPNNEQYYISANKKCIDTGADDTLACARRTQQAITVIFEDNKDLFDALLYKKYLDDLGYERVILEIPFMPYGQMDRELPDKMFSFKYFAQLINDANFYRVYFYDPHSYVMAAAIQRAQIKYGKCPHNNYDLFFYPDNGAAKKYSEIYPAPYRYGNKKRNLDTGVIIKYEVIADKADIEGKYILIRDDLCMGGRTFKEAAQVLNDMGARQIDLFISHLMPQAQDFYEHRDDFGITNFFTLNTLSMPWVEPEEEVEY